jgi:hypothetical protein
MQKTVGIVFAFKIFGHFAAQKSARDRVMRVTGYFCGVASGIDVDHKRAGVGTIESADGMFLHGHCSTIVAETAASKWGRGSIH